ncbi:MULTISPECIES: glutaminase [Micrococcus]|uniref:glutaminase n=1 Tax=Micrococcus antarcticus TaxID=86171 RepID=UPI00384F59E1
MMTPVQDHLDRLTAAFPGDDEGRGGLGVAVTLVDGHRYVSGSSAAVPLAALASPVLHALAVEDLGAAGVAERVGGTPVPEDDSRLEVEAETGRAFNPLQNTGVVATAALVKGRGGRDRAGRLLQLLSTLLDREVSVTETAVKVENRAQHQTRAAAWLLKSLDVLDTDPEPLLEDLATLRAVPVKVEDLALVAGTLAHGGIHPVTGARVLEEETVRAVLSVLDSCGMDTRQPLWAYDVGQPGWASTRGGTIMVVVPGHMGLALQAPDLDEHRVSAAGMAALRCIVEDFELHPSVVTGSPRAAFRAHYRVDQAPSGAVRSAQVQDALDAFGDTVHVLELGGHVGFSQVDALARVVRGLPDELETLLVDIRSVSTVTRSARLLVARWFAYALDSGLDVVLVDRDEAMVAELMAAVEESVDVSLPDPRQEAARDLESAPDRPEFLFFDSRSRAIQWAEQRLLVRHAPQLLPHSQEEAAVAPLLQHLSAEDAGLLESMMDERVYTDGQIIRRAGQPFGGIYVITSGRVELTGQGTGGRRTRRTVLTPGMTFGEMALGQSGRQPSTVRARGDVTARVLTAHVMYALQEGSPQLAIKLWEALARDAFTALGQLIRETGALQD